MKDNCYGEKLIALSSAIAFKISQTYSLEEIEVLAALFTMLGDQLALLSVTKSQNDCSEVENKC